MLLDEAERENGDGDSQSANRSQGSSRDGRSNVVDLYNMPFEQAQAFLCGNLNDDGKGGIGFGVAAPAATPTPA